MTEVMQVDSEERASFIVIFPRGIPPEHGEWRGRVRHVQSGEERPFHGAHQLLDIMESLALAEREGGDRS